MTPFDAYQVRMERRFGQLRHAVEVELNRVHGEAIKNNGQHSGRSIFPQLAAVQRWVEVTTEEALVEAKHLVDDARRQGKNAPDLWLEEAADRARHVLNAQVEALFALKWRIEPSLLPNLTATINEARSRSYAHANGEVDDFARGIWRPKSQLIADKTIVTQDTESSGRGGKMSGGHVFISYVREDTTVAEYVVSVLRANGLEVFWDRDIPPGRRWLDVIRDAIETGSYFVPLYSRRWEARERTVANEEVLLAREQLRRMPRERAWFMGVRVDDCAVPTDPIGAGESLRDVQFIDMPALGWAQGLERLLRALGVTEPKLPDGDPLAPGMAGQLDVTGGGIVFTDCTTSAGPIPAFDVFRGMKFFVSGGIVGRAPDGTVAAYITTDAPNANLQALNVQLGLHAAIARSGDKYVSADPAKPTVFSFARRYDVKAGDQGFNAATGSFETIPFDMSASITYEVAGAVLAGRFAGAFRATMDFKFLQVFLTGECELRFLPDHGPPADFAQLEAALGRRA